MEFINQHRNPDALVQLDEEGFFEEGEDEDEDEGPAFVDWGELEDEML